MTDIQPFDFNGNAIRIIMIADEPWFVLNDICAAIDLTQVHLVAKRLDQRDRSTATVTDSSGRDQEMTIVNESGMYDAVLDSRKPAAKEFRRKVTSEILPVIRKTGRYIPEAMSLPAALRAYAEALEEKDQASARAIAAESAVAEMRPKATQYDTYMDSTGLCSLAELAQALGAGRTRLIARLRELKILVSLEASQGGVRPMQPYCEEERGWFAVRMEVTMAGRMAVSYATPKGVGEVLRALVKHGVGEYRWGSLPTEAELFDRVTFQPDPEA